jgi:hypothetical protein
VKLILQIYSPRCSSKLGLQCIRSGMCWGLNRKINSNLKRGFQTETVSLGEQLNMFISLNSSIQLTKYLSRTVPIVDELYCFRVFYHSLYSTNTLFPCCIYKNQNAEFIHTTYSSVYELCILIFINATRKKCICTI